VKGWKMPNACCSISANLEVRADADGRRIEKCKICGLRQFTLKAEAGKIGFRRPPASPAGQPRKRQ